MENLNPIKMDDLGVPLLLETPISFPKDPFVIVCVSCPKGINRINPIQSYWIGMGLNWDHQSYEKSGGVWILRDMNSL